MDKNAKYYQQGDVLLVAVNNIPSKTKIKTDKIVAEGEVTGHMHKVLDEDAIVSVDKDGNIFVEAPTGTKIIHDEHGTIEVSPGKYQINIVQEYDPLEEEVRNVQD